MASRVLTCEKSSIAGRERQLSRMPSVLTETPMIRRSHLAFMRFMKEEMPPLPLLLSQTLSMAGRGEPAVVDFDVSLACTVE